MAIQFGAGKVGFDLRVYDEDGNLVAEGTITQPERDLLLQYQLIEKCEADVCEGDCVMYFNRKGVSWKRVKYTLNLAALRGGGA